MKGDDLLAYWGERKLRRWPADVVDRLEIDDDSKAFLANVGLPNLRRWTIRFDAAGRSLPVVRRGLSTYRRVGLDGTDPLCLDESDGGAFVGLRARRHVLNGSVLKFGLCVLAHQLIIDEGREAGVEDVRLLSRLTARFKKQVRAIDPVALRDGDGLWGPIIEEMETFI